MTTKRTKAPLETSRFPPDGILQLSLLELGTQPPDKAADPQPNAEPESDLGATRKRRRPRAPGGVVECGWCGQPARIPSRGRVPKWCSSGCRHRAWEQRRAADSGLCAVEVVERTIETVIVQTLVKPERVTVHVEGRPQSASEFATAILDLAHRLDTGRIYDRDIATLDAPVTALLEALLRRRKAAYIRKW